MTIVARFKPDHEGSYLSGVPSTDLTEEEFAALSDDLKAAVRASKLYTLTATAEQAAVGAERREARAEARAESAAAKADGPA